MGYQRYSPCSTAVSLLIEPGQGKERAELRDLGKVGVGVSVVQGNQLDRITRYRYIPWAESMLDTTSRVLWNNVER